MKKIKYSSLFKDVDVHDNEKIYKMYRDEATTDDLIFFLDYYASLWYQERLGHILYLFIIIWLMSPL